MSLRNDLDWPTVAILAGAMAVTVGAIGVCAAAILKLLGVLA